MIGDRINSDYQAGREAHASGATKEACPHGFESSGRKPTIERRYGAPLVRRHWWLAGWHDRDMEMGFSVLEVER